MIRLPGQMALAFVRRVHRRTEIIRCAEFVGIGVCVASIVSVVATSLLAWRGSVNVEPIVPTSILLALGAACGSVVAFRRRASLLDTAMHIDRALRADDLIASAILPHSDSTFAQTVLALADARVSQLSASSFPLRRFATRAWTGIGLAVACAVTTSLLFTTSATTMRANEKFDPMSSHARNGIFAGPEASTAKSNTTVPEIASESDSSTAREGNAKRDVAALSADASGEGRAQTNDLKERIATSDSTTIRGSSSAFRGERSATNGNGSPAHDSPRRPDALPSGTIARESSNAAPWSSADWPADRAAAGEAMRAGVIPDAYRDVIRAYFDLNK